MILLMPRLSISARAFIRIMGTKNTCVIPYPRIISANSFEPVILGTTVNLPSHYVSSTLGSAQTKCLPHYEQCLHAYSLLPGLGSGPNMALAAERNSVRLTPSACRDA